MNSEAWLERAERLRTELARLHVADAADLENGEAVEAQERVVIARWLRHEFSEEAPEDTQTLALFSDAVGRQ